MDKSNNEIKIVLNTATVASKCMLHIQETTDCLTQIYHAIDKLNEATVRPLPTDNFPITVDTGVPKLTFNEQKEATLRWTLTKSFEEFINGLTKSLKETFRILHMYALSLEPQYVRTHEEFEKEFQKIEKGLEDAHFPKFIEIIEEKLNIKLPLREEILSLNQIRNCLVHRHGLVSEKDIKNSPAAALRLKWLSAYSFTIIDGKEIPITYEFRKDCVTVPGFKIKLTPQEKLFKLGEKISITLNEFNDISFTCHHFVLQLYQLMPKQGT